MHVVWVTSVLDLSLSKKWITYIYYLIRGNSDWQNQLKIKKVGLSFYMTFWYDMILIFVIHNDTNLLATKMQDEIQVIDQSVEGD